MNNQVKLIDGNKILNNLMEYIDTFNDDLEFAIKEGEEYWADEISNKIELLQVFVDGIMSGAYKPDTVPTIKPGDKVRHKRLGESIVRDVVNDDVAEVAIGMVCYYVEIRDLEVVE